MTIKSFKLVSGEVILGRVDDSDENIVKFEKPVSIIMDPVQQGLGLMPWDAIYTQEETEKFEIDRKFIMYELPVHKTIEDAYIERTSGIKLAA